ncbi:MAG: hypothetical protein ABIG45_00990 [Bacillota bacterium]
MPSQNISQIQQELAQLKRDLENGKTGKHEGLPKTAVPSDPRRNPLMDFGLFVLAYFFWLIVIVTLEIAAGMGIHEYTCFFAVPCAWLTLAFLRKAPLYALLISAAGVLVITGAAYLASQIYDMAWDSNCYHKPVTGMLLHGWNPFEQTMIEFANTHDVLPYNSGWLSYQVNNQPKASFMIAASFYAFTGGIEYGKVFNLLSMIACVCIAAPLLRDAFRLSRLTALLAMLLTAANLITVSQIALYYNDGFTYQMLTVAAVSFAYGVFKPNGAFAPAAKIAAFMAVCIAVNIKTSAALYVAILCAAYIAARLIALRNADGLHRRNREILWMFVYFAAMAVCAVCVLGAATYVVNFLRYGNPFYGMLGADSMNSLLASLLGPDIHALPLIAQFFVSMFSPTSNSLFTEANLKIPFTFSWDEWTLATMDANVSGWGILFGGIFLVSALIVLVTAARMFRRSPRVSWLLLGVLATVILPAFFIPYLFSARYYLQPFWVPLAALVCLFAPGIRMKKSGKPRYPLSRFVKLILAPVLCGLLIVNAYTGYRYLEQQMTDTKSTRESITAIKEGLRQGGAALDVTTISRGLFYGLLFNLQDEKVEYNFCENLRGYDGALLYYLIYDIRDSGPETNAEAISFLSSLYHNEYLVVIAANGGGALTDPMTGMLQGVGLMREGPADPAAGYLAVIDPAGRVLFEQNAFGEYQTSVGGIDVQAISASGALSIAVGGVELSRGLTGYNIVVYDTENRLPVYSVVIQPGGSPVMTAFPVRLTGGSAQ